MNTKDIWFLITKWIAIIGMLVGAAIAQGRALERISSSELRISRVEDTLNKRLDRLEDKVDKILEKMIYERRTP